MTVDRRILPAAQAVLTDQTGRTTPQFYDFYRRIVQELGDLSQRIDSIDSSPGGDGDFMPITSNVIGADSILTQGILANGIVTVQLQGDTSDQRSTWYYGSDEDSEKGWFRFYTALGGDFGILKHNSGYTELGEVADPSDLPPTGNIGEAYWVDGAADITERGLWAWDGAAWVLDPVATGIVSFELDQSIDPTWTGNHTWVDNAEARWGTDGDLTIFHTGAAGVIGNATGPLGITALAGDLDLTASADVDILAGANVDFSAGGNVRLIEDNLELQIGAGQDLRLFHDGTDSFIRNDTGSLKLNIGASTLVTLSGNTEYVNVSPADALTAYSAANTFPLVTGPTAGISGLAAVAVGATTFVGARVGTSLSAPTAVGSGQALFRLQGLAYDGADSVLTGRVEFQTAEAMSVGANGGRIRLSAVALGTTTLTTALDITAAQLQSMDGVVGAPAWSFLSDPNTGRYRIGADSMGDIAGGIAVTAISLIGGTRTFTVGDGAGTTRLNFNRPADVSNDIALQTAGSDRWYLRINSSAESGSNTGSNFQLLARDDTGAALFTVLTATRSNGIVGFNQVTRFADGDASAPGVSFSSDADTGDYRIGANSIGRATGGVLRTEWRSDGGLNHIFSMQLSGDLTPAQITANTDNYNPTGLADAAALRLSTDASRNLTGIVGGRDGRVLILFNVGAQDLVLINDATSTAANRFLLGADTTLNANESILLWYDSTSSRWRAVGRHN